MQGILNQVAAPAQVEPPKKKRGSRKAWEVAPFEQLMKALAESTKLIGASYTHAAQPANVPRDAPDSSEWKGTTARTLSCIPDYVALREARAKLGKSTKAHNGGLDQYVYLDRKITAYINNSGVLGPHKIPVDAMSGGLGVATRTNVTSIIVSIIERDGLKHPDERKFIARNEALKAVVTDQDMETLKTLKPKTVKKKKPTTKAPRKEQPKIKIILRDGAEVAHFNFDVIPAIAGMHILPLVPRHVTDAQKNSIAQIKFYLSELTKARGVARKEDADLKKKNKQTHDIQRNIVPTQVMMLNVNHEFAGAAPLAAPVIPAGVPGVVAPAVGGFSF